jgi:regulator of sigma D
MNVTTLQKANQLNSKINACTEALSCFSWSDSQGKIHSTRPKIIVEFDGDGREQAELPFQLSEDLIDLLKNHIIKERDKLVKEFNDL